MLGVREGWDSCSWTWLGSSDLRAVVSGAAAVLCQGLEMVVVGLRVTLGIGAAVEWL